MADLNDLRAKYPGYDDDILRAAADMEEQEKTLPKVPDLSSEAAMRAYMSDSPQEVAPSEDRPVDMQAVFAAMRGGRPDTERASVAGPGWVDMGAVFAAMQPKSAPKEDGFISSASRGLENSFLQVPQLGYGLAAGAAAASEAAFGEGGLSTAAKDWAVRGYQDWGNKVAANSAENDDLNVAYDKAKAGDFGALVSWLGYGVGYTAGQAGQMLATAGAGSVIGKVVAKGAVEKFASGMVEKEAVKLAGEGATAEAIAAKMPEAVSTVAGKFGQYGALGASAYGMEGGEIYGDLVAQAQKEGRQLSGAELARAAGATMLAGTMEYGEDVLGLHVLKGNLPFGKSMTGIGGRLARGGIDALFAAPIEAATEYGQTMVEEYGKGNDPFSDATHRQAFAAAGLGAVGGAVHGGVGGIMSRPTVADITNAPNLDSAIAATDAMVSEPLSLPHYAGPPLVVMPDGSTMTGAEAEQQRLASMTRPVEYPTAEPINPERVQAIEGERERLRGIMGGIQSNEIARSAADQQLDQQAQQEAARRQAEEAAAFQRHMDEANAAKEFQINEIAKQALAQQADQAQQVSSINEAPEEPTAMQLAFQNAKKPEVAAGSPQQVQEQNNGLQVQGQAPAEAIATPAPLAVKRNGKGALVVSGNADDVRAAEASIRQSLPGASIMRRVDHDGGVSLSLGRSVTEQQARAAIDAINQGEVAPLVANSSQTQNVGGKFGIDNPGPMVQVQAPDRTEVAFNIRPDGTITVKGYSKATIQAAAQAIGAKVTVGENGNAIFSKTTDTAKLKKALGYTVKPKPRGLTGNLRNDLNILAPGLYNEVTRHGNDGENNTRDMSLVAEYLQEQGYVLPAGKPSDAVVEMIRQDFANGGGTVNAERQVAAMSRMDEIKHREEVVRLDNEYGVETKEGIKRRPFEQIEAEVADAIEHEVGIAGKTLANMISQARAAGVGEDEIKAIANEVAGRYIGDRRQDAKVAQYREAAGLLEDRINELEEAATRRDEQGSRAVEDQGEAVASGSAGFHLEGQTESEARSEAGRVEPEITREQIDREATAPFTLTQESQPSRDAVTGGQGGLFTPDGRPSAQVQNAKSDATLARTRERNEVRFETPYTGKTGAQLVGYVWPNKKEEFIDKRGEDRVRTVSDWERAVENLDTGRQIVHQFAVRSADGAEQDVSAETAAKLLGISESAVRSGAKRLLEKEITKAKRQEQERSDADKIDAITPAGTPAKAVEGLATTYHRDAAMVQRMAKNGPAWSSIEDRIERDGAKAEKYRFLVRDGKYIWSPEVVRDGSELYRRGWRNEELRADSIWPAQNRTATTDATKTVAESSLPELMRAVADKMEGKNPEKLTPVPVAESQAPAPSEPGDGGVAPTQDRQSAAPDRASYYAEVEIGKKGLDRQIEADKKFNGATFRYSPFSVNGIEYLAIERDHGGWNRGHAYEVQDATGFPVQSLSRDGRQIGFGQQKYGSRKEIAERFQTLVEDGWEPHDQFYYETNPTNKENLSVTQGKETAATLPSEAAKEMETAQDVVAQADAIDPAADEAEPITKKQRLQEVGQEARIQDFGEKIGGARKDKAVPIGPRARMQKEEDSRPAWARKYHAMQSTVSGKWNLSKEVPGMKGAVKAVTRDNFATEQEALDAIPLVEASRNHRVYLYDVKPATAEHNEASGRAAETKWGIYRKITDKKTAMVRGGFGSHDAAMRYLTEHSAEIIEHKFGFPERPWLDKIERIGPERRDGDVTPKMFQDTFGFRGGEFGNWNMGGDGQAALNHAYDALMDLADAIGVPPRAISLNGQLAMAFGARGTGGKNSSAAHYEPERAVINLTKIKGAGSAAHEWWHAADHYFAKPGNRGHSVVADGFGYKPSARQELVDAFKRVVDTINYAERSQTTDADIVRTRAQTRLDSATNDLDYRLRDLRNPYQPKRKLTDDEEKRWDALADKLRAGDLGESVFIENPSKVRGAMGFTIGANIRDLNSIYKSWTGRSFLRTDPASVGRQMEWIVKAIAENKAKIDTKEDVTTNIKGRTDFYIESKRIDGYRSGDYWSTPEEMGARAFESYIFDKLTADQKRSDYLVYGIENRYYSAMDMKPYPEGEERKAIDAAFDNLFSTIKTRETDKGVALESRSDRLSFARQVLTDLAAEDEMFRYPVSKSKSIDGVMADVFPDALYWGESTQPDERSESGADHRFTFQLPKYRDDKGRMVPGKPFYVYTTDDGRVWINVLNLSPGARGSNIYAAVANYAYNTGKKFVGDPLGVSEDAVVARTKMMLSSTLRFGTTRHLDASPEQIKGNTEEGIEPLDWSGDDIDRVESLIHTFITTLQNRLPELKNYHYDFAKQGFFDNDGKRIAEPVQDVGNKAMESGDVEGRSGGGIRSARAGKASLRLGILIQSLVSEEGRAIGDGGILEAVLNQSGSLVNNGQLDGLMSKAPERGLSVSSAKIESVRDRFMQEFKGAEALDIRVVNSRDDIPARFRPSPYAVGVYHDDVGLVYLIASKIESPERAAQILMHEAVGHYGLMNMMGDKFQPILGDVLRVARAKGELTSRPEVGDANYATVEAVRMDYPEVSDDVIAQEVLARMAEIGGKQSVFKIAVMRIRQWLRGVAKALGIDYDFTEQDARDLVALAGEHLRNGKNLAAETEGEGVAYASRAGLESRSAVTGASGRDYTPEQLSAFKRTGRTVEVPTLKERVAALTDNWSMKLRQGIADQFAPLAQLDKHAYVQARMSKAYDGALEALMLYGKVRVDGGIYNADMSGGVLDRLLRPLGNEVDDFMWWTAAKRAERLSAEDREHLFTQADIDAMKALATGKTSFDYTLSNGTVTRSREMIYRDAAKVMDEFNKSILDIAEQSGLIDGASRSIWENEFYIPFYRALEDEKVGGPGVKSGLVRQYAFKQLKGGSGELNHDLIANVLQNWAHLLAASAKNRAAASALQAAKRTGVADEVPAGTKGAVYYLDKGEQKHFVVNDPFLMDAISAIEFGGFKGPVMKVMGKFKHYLTLGVTANPAFKIRNLIRDSIAAIGQSDLDTNPLKNLKQGFKATDKSKQTYVSMLASGGIVKFGSMLEGNRADHVRQLIEEGVSEDTILDSESKIKAFWRRRIKPAIEAYNDLGDRGESINRAALYEQMIAKGMSHEEASYAARDLLDFSMGGAWQGVRLLTQVVPFMNARIQGLYKLGRADKKRLGYVVGAVSLASLALLAAYGDDDDWKKREDWDRESYWWFKFGGVAFRIPKPFEIGAIGTLAERSAELFFDNEMTGKRYMDRLGALVGSQLAMNPVPQLFKPIVDIYANKDSFSGRPIETMGMEKLRTEDRYTARTSEIAKILGKAGMMSPVQIDQAIRGYFGWLGTATTGAIDYMARVADDTPRPEMKLRDVFLAGNFVETLPTNSSRYVSQMYDQAKEIEEAWNSLQHYRKLGETEKAQQILEENRDELGRYHAVERVKRDESEINRKIQQIEQSKGLSPETKRKLLDQLSQQRDRVARRLAAA